LFCPFGAEVIIRSHIFPLIRAIISGANPRLDVCNLSYIVVAS
jgi:hypothetical protein